MGHFSTNASINKDIIVNIKWKWKEVKVDAAKKLEINKLMKNEIYEQITTAIL